ncbi:MAG: HAD family hydrolase [Clostridia bacterium]|nr:HAD family hydrolase [Clostridia bacterium]
MNGYKYDAVIWDYNGTLADDVEASLFASNEIIVRHGKEPITMEQYYEYLDYPISRFWEHVFDLGEFPMAKIGEEYYKAYPKYFRGLCDGAAKLVFKLHRAGVVQMILTSAHPRLIGETLREAGIEDCFEAISSSSDLLAGSKIDRGVAWLEKSGIAPGRAVTVGDTLHDYDAARTMGTDCILCSFGHQSKKQLLTAGVPVVDAFGGIERYLKADN